MVPGHPPCSFSLAFSTAAALSAALLEALELPLMTSSTWLGPLTPGASALLMLMELRAAAAGAASDASPWLPLLNARSRLILLSALTRLSRPEVGRLLALAPWSSGLTLRPAKGPAALLELWSMVIICIVGWEPGPRADACAGDAGRGAAGLVDMAAGSDMAAISAAAASAATTSAAASRSLVPIISSCSWSSLVRRCSGEGLSSFSVLSASYVSLRIRFLVERRLPQRLQQRCSGGHDVVRSTACCPGSG